MTVLAKREWKNRSLRKLKQPSPPRPDNSTQQPSQGDQSPRPANYRQIQRQKQEKRDRSSSIVSVADPAPAKKRPRYSCSPSAEPVPSIISARSPSAASEVPEFDQPTEFVVRIPKAPNFDPSEFLSVAGSQSASYPSQSLSELEEQDRRLALSSQISRRTVPDSQEYSGQTLSTASGSYPKAAESIVTSPDKESRCALIPDSLDRVEIGTTAITDTNNPEEHIPESSIAGALCADSDIPSHQQEPEDHYSSNHTSKSPHATPSDPALGLPVFLSQIEIDAPASLLSSSTASKQPSPAPSLVSNSPPEQQSLRASQDAQVVKRTSFFDIVLAREPDSSIRSSPSKSKDATSPAQFAGILNSPPQQSQSMADDSGHPPATRRSAVDELLEMAQIPPLTGPSSNINQANELYRTKMAADAQLQPQGSSSSYTEVLAHIQWQPATQPPAINTPVKSDTVAATAANNLHPFNTQLEPDSQMLMPMHLHEPQQSGTISPSDLLESADVPPPDAAPRPILDLVASTADFGSSAAEPITLGQASPESPSSSTTSDDPVLMQHIITLPFQASLRPQYDDTLLAHRKQVKEFSEVFSSEDYNEPSDTLVGKIDDLLTALRNLCDYPQDLIGTTLETLDPRQQVKYACDANPKFCFVFELLQGIESNIRVLIVAQSAQLLRLLAHVAETLEIDCISKSIATLSTGSHESACTVTLALPNEEIDTDDFEVVIGFDHAFGGSPMARALSQEGQAVRPPLVLTLVTTHSIEHIDQQLPSELGALERRNALLAGIVNARKLTSDPDRGYPEPHEIAIMFCEYLNGVVEGVLWEPLPLPEEVLDIYMSSQSQVPTHTHAIPDAEGGRKRKLNDDTEDDAKRVRTIPQASTATSRIDELPLPDDVRWLLDSVAAASRNLPGTGVSIQVSLSVLQALAEKNSELERRAVATDMEVEYKAVIKGLETRVKDNERTSSKTQRAYRAAVEDRTVFEREKKKADAALQSAQASAQRESDKLQTKIVELEATILRLISSSSDGSAAGESPLAISERLLKDATEKIRQLEKRLENATQDGEYTKNAYQDASNAASVLQNENKELREQNEKLLQRSADNVTRIHEIQNESMARTYLKEIENLKVQMRERELELDRARDEVRQSRTRRETRQGSVPRSPRMALMSPRAGGRGGPGPASRGTSPSAEGGAAMIGALPISGNGNGRWNHLRE